jgi:hypothetical protein
MCECGLMLAIVIYALYFRFINNIGEVSQPKMTATAIVPVLTLAPWAIGLSRYI